MCYGAERLTHFAHPFNSCLRPVGSRGRNARIALQEAEEASFHLLIKGAMHLKKLFAEGGETEEDLFFVLWQGFLGNQIFGD